MAIRPNQIAFLAVLVLAFFLFDTRSQAEFSIIQTYRVVPPKLTVEDIKKVGSPLPDGGFNWIVRLSLTRNAQPPISFDLNINDAKTEDDIYTKLKQQAVNQLVSDLETAAASLQPPSH
jgi:hypothetical protein